MKVTAAVGAALALAAATSCGTGPLQTATHAAGAGGGDTAGGSAAGGSATGGATGGTAGAGGGAAGPIDFCKGCTLKSGCSGFASADIKEASGIASSAVHDGAIYVHNDSGDTPRFFATNCAGDDLGVYEVQGATAVDWEDMARGPCGGMECLFFADIGDNDAVRPSVAVYRVVEPAALAPGVHQVQGEKLTLTYPDGSHNAETFLVHPQTGAMAIVTKVTVGNSTIYTVPEPFSPGATVALVAAGEVQPPSGSVRFTGGAVHPSAEGILLRTYTNLFFYALLPNQTLGDALTKSPCEVPSMLELQGEAVTFTAKGDGYVTVSEQTGQSLHFASCN